MPTYKLVTCPYDPVHKLKENRMQMHISKCRLNHLHEEKYTCPFNATHVMPKQENVYHLQHCPDKGPLDRKLAEAMDKNNPNKGRTAVPSYSHPQQFETEEIWDDGEIQFVAGYVPPSQPPPGAIIEPPPMSKRAERTILYKELHLRKEEPQPRPASTYIQPPRQAPSIPRQPVQSTENSRIQNGNDYDIHGFGRGRGSANRIAANIFPGEPAPPTSYIQAPQSYSAITANFSQLGLGRGMPSSTSAADEKEFPTLASIGMGRGMYRAPKTLPVIRK